MGAFFLDMSNPFPSGASGIFHGGPGEGGHVGNQWYEAFGMDFGAPAGIEVVAVFDAKVTDFKHPTPAPGVFGDQIWMRAANATLDPNDPGGVGIFYTHLQADSSVSIGASIARGSVIGTISSGTPSHLHFALAERRGGTNFGVNLYSAFKAGINTTTVMTVRFPQDGSPPTIL
ncbi:peptidoglycan DD-metalloendopeptidase family protein [Kitasatospora purpeofusca]|uniref:peptidoglycan DD-metalloendopeptidase family protein n=1 Tax=Kitasatospora purpeofusca TaxID=67352 RepID=UPI00364E3AE2